MSNAGPHIVLVDDTKALADMYSDFLQGLHYNPVTIYSGQSLISYLAENNPVDLLILDIKLPDIDGLDLLNNLRDMNFNAPVIIITGNGSINTAVEAMRRGAADFLVKPFSIEKLADSVARSLQHAGLSTKALTAQPDDALVEMEAQKSHAVRAGFGGFIGISQPMQLIYDVIENAARSNATAFITGESGTGKEVCAEAIHRYSKRAKQPFIAINCAAIPRELLESELFGHVKGAFTGAVSDRDGAVAQAYGGTLFLDEIAEMAPDMQSKLLRFLQNFSYQKVGGNKIEKANVRVICATNRDPLEEIRMGRLRQDLYYRLHVIPIHMPPLRQRLADIVDLADYFLKLYAREENKAFQSFSKEAEKKLLSYPWPGNIRQLQNVIRGIVVLHNAKIVTPDLLPTDFSASIILVPTQHEPIILEDSEDVTPLWKVEKSAIEKAIALCQGNIPRAAAMLEISPSTIYRKKLTWDKGLGRESYV
jgi:two-component system repressor protein LuxO